MGWGSSGHRISGSESQKTDRSRRRQESSSELAARAPRPSTWRLHLFRQPDIRFLTLYQAQGASPLDPTKGRRPLETIDWGPGADGPWRGSKGRSPFGREAILIRLFRDEPSGGAGRRSAKTWSRNDEGPARRPPRRRISHRARCQEGPASIALGGALVAAPTIPCQPYFAVQRRRHTKY